MILKELIVLNGNSLEAEYIPDNRITQIILNGQDLEIELFKSLKNTAVLWDKYAPLESDVYWDTGTKDIIYLVFESLESLNRNGKFCLATLMSDYFFSLFNKFCINEYYRFGKHVLVPSIWSAILSVTREWEKVGSNNRIHKGSPYYFLAESLLMCGDKESAFIYLSNSIEEDSITSTKCAPFKNLGNRPAMKVGCLLDDVSNHMYEFIVKPARLLLQDYIKQYNLRYGTNVSLNDVDKKFLRRMDSAHTKVERVKFLFVLQILKLLRMKSILSHTGNDNELLRKIILNIVFPLALVVDKLLLLRYRTKSGTRGREPDMYNNIEKHISKKNKSGKIISQLNQFKGTNFNNRNLDSTLSKIFANISNNKYPDIPMDIYPLLVAYKIRNTSAHKIIPQSIIFKKFDMVLQCLIKAVLVVIQRMQSSRILI